MSRKITDVKSENCHDIWLIIQGLVNTINGLPFEYQASPVEATGRSMQNHFSRYLKKASLNKAVFI